jgi:anti-sigma factor ChrR (cupin superfamily)
MESMLVNADFSRRVVLATNALPWLPSPQAGVERRLLDRVGDETARATSLVRYAAGSAFTAHAHGLGEEFLVLDGVFSDEHGDYPRGSYVRNPPGSRHAPRTAPGCVIFVKLRQMAPGESHRVVIDTMRSIWKAGDAAGHTRLLLHAGAGELVSMEQLEPGSVLAVQAHPAGEEIFVVSGELEDGDGRYGAGTWLRNPAGAGSAFRSASGALYCAKRGHLPPRSEPDCNDRA